MGILAVQQLQIIIQYMEKVNTILRERTEKLEKRFVWVLNGTDHCQIMVASRVAPLRSHHSQKAGSKSTLDVRLEIDTFIENGYNLCERAPSLLAKSRDQCTLEP